METSSFGILHTLHNMSLLKSAALPRVVCFGQLRR